LGVANLLDKSALTTIHHQNVRSGPDFIIRAAGISLGGVNILIAQGIVGVIDVLSNRTTVGGDSKEGFTVIITIFRVKTVGNL